MKCRMLISKVFGMVVLVTMLVSCKEQPKEVEVEARRELSQYDNPKVYKIGYETWAGTQPLSWRKVNRTNFRLLNYAAEEATEIAVGQVDAGGVLANVNRWIGEFEQEQLEDVNGLEKFETFQMLGGRKAYLITLKGMFQKKMGGKAMKYEGWAMSGVICEIGGGSLVTVKMMGPEAEVDAQKENLIKFAKSLRINPLQTPNERSKKDKKADLKEEGGY